jgi:serine/tyrosine/threonine adenylyltransferase
MTSAAAIFARDRRILPPTPAAASPSSINPENAFDLPPPTNSATSTTNLHLSSLEDLQWSPTFTTELPADPNEENKVRQVQGAFFSWVNPTSTGTEPSLVAASAAASRLIGLDPSEAERPEFAMVFSGNAPLSNTRSYAQCYGGHQFGSWAGQLGDGRAICLGEVINPETGVRWELQLKGAGKTPYSRMADGRAVLRSSLREFVASEAMAALGVPTTRALSLVATGDRVVRDMFYSGNPELEPGAVVCRVARSFVRFGSFQLPVSRGDEQVALAQQVRFSYVLCFAL